MDERLRFVARLLDGEKMAALCREFDVSRKTGYKIFQRYKDCGLEGLTDRSRRPCRQANQLPFQIEKLIVQLRSERPSWGAPKIREKLRRLHSDISDSGHQHGARGARSTWPGHPRSQTTLQGPGHDPVQAGPAQ
jgi:putative transposase